MDAPTPPIDLAKVCTSVQTATGTTQTTCDDPWVYYKANSIDIVVFFLFAYMIYKFIKEQQKS